MAIDSNIYFRQETPDIIGGVERGLKLADLVGERREKAAQKEKQKNIDSIYSSSMIMNPDGTISFNENAFTNNLAKQGYGREAMQFQQESRQNKAKAEAANLDIAKQRIGIMATLLQDANDQKSWERSLMQAAQNGIDISKEPTVFDRNYVAQMRERTGKAQQDLENRFKQQELNIKREGLNIDRERIGAAQSEKKEIRQEKQNLAVTEIQDRYLNIKDSIKNLRGLIDQYGTQEMIGPQNAQMDQYITAIATDMAKLVDPESVARESEVASFKSMLVKPTFWQRESTQKAILNNFENLVDKRLETAYKVRGLEKRPSVTEKTVQKQAPTPEQAAAILQQRQKAKASNSNIGGNGG